MKSKIVETINEINKANFIKKNLNKNSLSCVTLFSSIKNIIHKHNPYYQLGFDISKLADAAIFDLNLLFDSEEVKLSKLKQPFEHDISKITQAVIIDLNPYTDSEKLKLSELKQPYWNNKKLNNEFYNLNAAIICVSFMINMIEHINKDLSKINMIKEGIYCARKLVDSFLKKSNIKTVSNSKLLHKMIDATRYIINKTGSDEDKISFHRSERNYISTLTKYIEKLEYNSYKLSTKYRHKENINLHVTR